MSFKQKVLDHFECTLTEGYDNFETSKTHDVSYITITLADGYEIYRRDDGDTGIYWDSDFYYYAENMNDILLEDISSGGKRIFVDDEILEAVGLDSDDSWGWEELYLEKVKEDDDEDNQ